MKKFINAPEDVERQVVDGYVKSYPSLITKAADDIVVRTHRKQGKVALVSGGGMGHEPAHLGYVGAGMLDAAVGGAIYTSPAVDRISAGIDAVAPGNAGVLLVIKNYTGDVINFKMAQDAARDEGIACDHVIVNDDVAVGSPTERAARRGVAGTVFVHKCAGAAAEAGKPLAEVKRVAEKVIDNVRTMGVAIAPCTVPAAGKPGFELADDEMEMGVGIHGEPGIRREKMEPVDAMVDEILEHVLADIDYAGHEVAVLVNGAGGTPDYELALVANRVHDVLAARNIPVWHTYMGNYLTSLEMRGFSISLLRLDDELKNLLAAPSQTPAWTQGEVAAGTLDETGTVGGATSGDSAHPEATKAGSAAVTSPKPDAKTEANAPTDPQTALVVRMLATVADSLDAHKDELTELDMPIGDSDHGINMARGFDAVRELLPELASKDAATALKKAGATVVSRVGGSSGPLYGTLLRKLGATVKKQGGLTVASLAAGLEAGLAGVEELAGGKPGDKTMIDAIAPAVASLKASATAGTPATEALTAAARAASEGVDATIPMTARKGRASYLGERSIGHKDPGAASFALIMQVIAKQL